MIDIGPNLLAAILALVSLGTAAVAAWRAEHALAHAMDATRQAQVNMARIVNLENHAPK